MEQMTSDVVRFMYQNKISTATLGGHGIGAKLALATGCYHPDRVSGNKLSKINQLREYISH